ncbi:MAG: hypothetical protein WB992_15100 [Bryobacteraceae bacterium]
MLTRSRSWTIIGNSTISISALRIVGEDIPWRSCVVLAAIVVTYSMFQNLADRLIYYPMRYPQGDRDLQAKAGAQDRWIQAADGTQLNA